MIKMIYIIAALLSTFSLPAETKAEAGAGAEVEVEVETKAEAKAKTETKTKTGVDDEIEIEIDLKEKLKKGLLKSFTENPLINEIVNYQPIEEHHFNLEAPQECGKDSSIKATAKTISCQFHSDGEREVVVSVCDHKKTYCKQEKIKAVVQKIKSTQPKIKENPNLKTLKMQRRVKEKIIARFKVMTPDEAIQAISTKQAALVMISADWCPPCNQVTEFTLQTEVFKNATKDLLLIYVDGDNPASEVWTQKLKTKYYPSFVVLNQNLDRVSVFSSINSKKHVERLNRALKNLNDPLDALAQRIEERKRGDFLRKIKDFFYSNENLIRDQKRHIEYLAAVGKYDEVLSYLESVNAKGVFKDIEMKSYYLSSKEKDEEFLEAFLDLNLNQNLNQNSDPNSNSNSNLNSNSDSDSESNSDPDPDPDPSSYYYYVLRDYCEKTKVEEDFSKACQSYKENYIQSLKVKESWPKQEKMLMGARYSKIKAHLADFFNEEKSKTKSLYARCVQDFDKLYEISPLGKKSRFIRIEQVDCLKSEGEEVEVLKSLAQDYPFEETFHRKLATHYAKNKAFKKALASNQNAIDYSYGYMWIYNVAERANYLRKVSKNKEALTLVEFALSEVVLNKEDTRLNRALKSLRAQYNALRVL